MIKKMIKNTPWIYNKYLQYKIRKSWFTRKSSNDDNHLEMYWNDRCETRKMLVDILHKLLNEKNNYTKNSVLEFGSHVGTNLKLLSEKTNNVKMYAIEPNYEAYQFIKSHLSFVEAYNADDSKFIKSDFPKEKVYLSVINSVFYCMTPNRVEAVLKHISSISQVIIIGDSMKNVRNYESNFNSEPVYFSHPYIVWLEKFGFSAFEIIHVPNGQPQLDAYLIAKK